MAKTKVRRIIRKRKVAHAEPFDEQLWPIQLTLVILGGFLVGLVLAYLRFNDLRWWANAFTWLTVVPIAIGGLMAAAQLVDRRAMRRAVQLSLALCILVHVLLGVVMWESVIFRRFFPENQRVAEAVRPERVTIPDYHRFQLHPQERTQQDFLQPVETQTPEPEQHEELQQENLERPQLLERVQPQPQPVPEPEPSVRPAEQEQRRPSETAPRVSEQQSQLSRQTTQTAPQAIAQAVTAPRIERPTASPASPAQAPPTPVERQASDAQAHRRPVQHEPTAANPQPETQVSRRETAPSPVPETTAAPTLPRRVAEPEIAPRTPIEPAPQVASAQQTQPQEIQPSRVAATRQSAAPTPVEPRPVETPEAAAQPAPQLQRRQVDAPTAPTVAQAPAPQPQERTPTPTRPAVALSAENPTPSVAPQPTPATPTVTPQTSPLTRQTASASTPTRSESEPSPATPRASPSPTGARAATRRLTAEAAPTIAQTPTPTPGQQRAVTATPHASDVAATPAPATAPAASAAPAAVRPTASPVARQATSSPAISQNPLALETPSASPTIQAARPSPTRAPTTATSSANPQAVPAARPRRSATAATIAASPTPVESPALAEASHAGEAPALRPAQLALSRGETGLAGVGASVNLDRAAPTSAGASAVASGAAVRATARSAQDGPELSPSAPALVARANADRPAPSATLQASAVAVPNALGAEQPTDINASSSAALTRSDSEAEAASISAAAGTVAVDLGPTRIVATTGASRGEGGGQPELNPQQQARTTARSAASGAPEIALATPITADTVTAPEGTGGGDPPRPHPQIDALAAAAANPGGAEPISGGPSSAVETGPIAEASGAAAVGAVQVARAQTLEAPPGAAQAGGGAGDPNPLHEPAQLARAATRSDPNAVAPTADVLAAAGANESPDEDEEKQRLAALAALEGQTARADVGAAPATDVAGSAGQPGPSAPPSDAAMAGAARAARAPTVAAAPGAPEAGGGTRSRTRSSTGPALATTVLAEAPTLAGAPESAGQPNAAPLASSAGELNAPAAGGILAQAMSGPTGALQGPEAIDAPRDGPAGPQLGRRAASSASADGPLAATAANAGSPGRRESQVALAGGLAADAPPAFAASDPGNDGAVPDMAAVAGTMDDMGEMDMSQLAFEAARGARPVNVPAPDGPGGLSDALTPDVGLANRRGQPDAEVVHFREARFVRREVGGAPAVNLTALAPAEAYAQRLRPKEAGDQTGGGGPPPLTEEAVEAGLAFLAKHQMPDGSWSFANFGRGRPGYENETAALESDAAATGLALLAFQGGGYTHQHGKYKDTVRKALEFLVRNQKPDGDLYLRTGGPSDAAMWLYSHGVATLALCEAHGMTQDPALREPTQKALDFIVAGQHKTRGGWRYSPNYGADTSVTGWMMMALKSGELAGLNVSGEALRNVETWLDMAQKSATERHLYVYNPLAPDTPQQRHGRRPNPTMTSVGLLMRLYTGWRRDSVHLVAGAEYLLSNPPAVGTRREPQRDAYYWYYATQVLFHMGGDYWKAWNDQLHPLLIESQEKTGPMAGSWDPRSPVPDRWGPHCGRLYVTTLNLLSLEVYYRHLPLYVETAK